ncbi:DUF4982 domain-containing protein [Termitidicoccus mucosus]|uniref:glycoside hydrolase family 2 protein n=1 Tax=Termitidicoccus mucosus TaxID=1184151 RepID=UPI002FEDF22F
MRFLLRHPLLLAAAAVACVSAKGDDDNKGARAFQPATLADKNVRAPFHVAAQPVRDVFNFNLDWRLHVGDPAGAQAPDFDDRAWKRVTLPHAWNEDDAFRRDIRDHSTGVAWYRKTFTLPPGSEGKKVFVEFEGVRQAGEFFLNGRAVGLSENGVMAVGLDLTDFVRPPGQPNVLAVRTDNDWDYRERATGQRYQWADKNFNANYGGLTKNARLHLAGKLYQTLPLFSNLGTTGVYVYATGHDVARGAATLTAESEVRNETAAPQTVAYRVSVADMDGRVVAIFASTDADAGEFSILDSRFSIEALPRPVEGENATGAAAPPIVPSEATCPPNRKSRIKNLATLAPGETKTLRASRRVEGLHFWSWGYGYLYTVTTELLVDGRVVDRVATRTGFRKTDFSRGLITLNDRVLQMKGHAQRTSNEWPALGLSVPPWLSDFSNGLIVEGNGNLVRWMHVTPWKQDIESCDRVGLIQAMPAGDSERDPDGRRWGQRVELMRDAIIYNRNNPSILFYECGNRGISEEHMREMKALRDAYDPHGGRAIGSREMLASRVAEYGGEMLYINKSARLPFWATEYSRDEGLRKYWDEFSPPYHRDGDGPPYRDKPAPEYNRNQDSHAIENVTRWFDYWRERPGTGARVSSGGVNIIFSDSNTHHRGAENYRRSGEVDAMRIPKDGFFAHQVMWDGWVDVERPRIHVLGHWNYAPGVVKSVHAVSSADEVEFFLNGRPLGRGAQSRRFLFTLENVAWEPGELCAVGYAKRRDGTREQVCETAHITAGEPAALRLRAMTGPAGFKADGADVALVEFEVVDAQGRRCPTALNPVTFALDGPAEWRGGIAQGPGNHILDTTLPVEGGVNRVLVRSTREAGVVTLRATSPGLRAAAVELVTTAVAADAGGLARALPADALPSYLKRGPTPATPSFTPTRIAVPIQSATAGSNAGEAWAAFDDDETTRWRNDGAIETAWLTCTLARPAVLGELTMKLTGWRQQTYPLVVLVDGQEVWRGETGRSLGYITLPLKPVRGRELTLKLVGAGESTDAFGITELEAPPPGKIPDPGSVQVRAGVLSIIELECYEAVEPPM